ncbi:Signal transduction histidine-protein kinase/phosphatase DegS [Anaerolineales bacterium]|nr:Signal transduction histidine-protein kinase/phosphatase DegS [Anaerolineales bacterium]
MKRFLPGWRGLTQLFAVTILPLTLLLLVIAFGGVNMHQQDMRALVGERDERAVQSSAAALESELHHRVATITSMAVLSSEDLTFEEIFATTNDLTKDFNGGIAFLNSDGHLLASTGNDRFWEWISKNAQSLSLATSSDREPVFSSPILDPNSGQLFVIISAYSASRDVIVAGAFSPETLAAVTLSATYPTGSQVTIYLLDKSRRLIFVSGELAQETLEPDHPGVTEALQGGSGVLYVKKDNTEHVVAYSPIELTGWALITEEEWEMVISPSLQLTQMAPLVVVPAFILALIAIWFGAKQIVQPLQRLESKAAALAWGDFEAIKESVGGISEVQHLQMELTEMSRKVQAAQDGLHDYIGAITSAQEDERMRLARELHDDTIQAVIALKQRVQLAQKAIKDQHGRQSLTELGTLAEQTIENLRRLIRALRPIYLEDLGLVTALDMLASETSQNNHLAVDFQNNGQEHRLSREVELSLYRIAQEALNNVVKHSKATHVELKIAFETSEIKMEVNDNGNGFVVPKSPTELAPSGYFGLLGIHERADLIGARLKMESALGKGTSLKVVLSELPS